MAKKQEKPNKSENSRAPLSSETEEENKQEPSDVRPRDVVIGRQVSFVGPLPPPEVFSAYEDTLPGAADRILAMAEKQSSHRQEMESKALGTSSRQGTLGQIFAFILSLVVIIIGGFLIYKDKDISGLVIVISVIVSLVGLFIYGKRRASQEELKKIEQVEIVE